VRYRFRLPPGQLRISIAAAFSAVALALGCNVDDPPGSTGGARGETCERFALVQSDYASTQVALVNAGGEVISSNVISSGTRAPGATSALSGDVVLPHDPPASGSMVLIDRYPNGILTWLDADSGEVTGQLNVVPGFASNPHDYLEITPEKAYVTRFGTNHAPSRVEFDQGGDILVIDPSRRAISKRIDLSSYGGTADPRPDRMTLGNGRAYVVLARLDPSFERGEDGLVVVIDTASDTVVDTIPIPGLNNCTGLALSPDARSLAVTCSGLFKDPGSAQVATSGVVVVDLESKTERLRATASTLGGALASPVGFATNDTLVVVVLGGPGDNVMAIDVATARATTLHSTQAPFMIGDLFCGCGDSCIVPNAEGGSLLAVDAASARPLAPLSGSSLPARAVCAIGPTKAHGSAP
jgi:DNA-binding beta-propeller fold protein YncE